MQEKRNKVGRRITFVRFDRKENFDEFLQAVKGIWIGYHKILANIAGFDPKVKLQVHPKKDIQPFHVSSRRRDRGLTYLEASINLIEEEAEVQERGKSGQGEKNRKDVHVR